MAFVDVVDAGGFSAASRRFDIPVSRLSRNVAVLERQLGVTLLSRNARRFHVTEVGRRIHEQGLSMRVLAQNALAIARESLDEPAGELSVQWPAAWSAGLVGRVANEFVSKFPRAELKLQFTTDGHPSVLDDSVDLLIQPSSKLLPDSSLVARKLAEYRYLLAASPALLETLPDLSTPQGLAGCPVIGCLANSPPYRWQLHHAEHGAVVVEVAPRFFTDNLTLARESALAGTGIVQLPATQCAAELRAGRLQVVLPGWEPPAVAINAIFHSRRVLTAAGRVFLDMLSQAFVAQSEATA
ncbi:LysR substrate-binding domain-containing protein [Variovorax sp. Sphag1AA]|uniref:LysR substrate-binding domain-containing protein n=1 Tax=Variovorax sp. Sphag1AA TaxID=2587027 RepID=UPI0017904245|nr:LysR substrate-binding domain-containing protein [Variovorax sp. Sphag1AA]MBB3179198.1 DNA-binding transcriptional LysR family regulator [Variovorax sp. Sphag1AA]